MEFMTPRQPHRISVSVSLQFDGADPISFSPNMYVYKDDPTVSTVDPKTAIIR